MSKISVVVIDDEQEARDGICLLLQSFSELELMATCENGLEAIEKINQIKPDLIFLDIQMPRVNGFEVLNSIDQHCMPMVIFVTAYDKYALKAFEYHAIDYLLKPYTDDRFKSAVDYALRLMQSTDQADNNLQKLIKDYIQKTDSRSEQLLSSTQLPPHQLIVKSEGKILFLPLNQITHISAENYYIRVHALKSQHLVRESLKTLEKHLSGTSFIRIHKSTLVNSQFIHQVEPYFNGEMMLKLSNAEKLKVSRHYRKNLPTIFG